MNLIDSINNRNIEEIIIIMGKNDLDIKECLHIVESDSGIKCELNTIEIRALFLEVADEMIKGLKITIGIIKGKI